ncbi:hypothetical protein NP493_881g00010 [Ridgeia piscesae]|uniref:EGF-like domain-containing protein n=1 Tax=Ridgeia piscesae TaxID=27915 RepID=A0AAD9NKG8_RIDPI|nr:hypothetical protein NP493_881g00010 [Ridgeia piscesae]
MCKCAKGFVGRFCEIVETGYRSNPSVAVAKSSERTRRDGTMALARTSSHVLANPDNMAVLWSRRKQLELRKILQLYVYLQIHQPMADRKVNGLNKCSGNPCDNGASCSDSATGVMCKCAKGFVGRFCERLNKCSGNPCDNGASCSDSATGVMCKCAKGFVGRFCEKSVKEDSESNSALLIIVLVSVIGCLIVAFVATPLILIQ